MGANESRPGQGGSRDNTNTHKQGNAWEPEPSGATLVITSCGPVATIRGPGRRAVLAAARVVSRRGPRGSRLVDTRAVHKVVTAADDLGVPVVLK